MLIAFAKESICDSKRNSGLFANLSSFEDKEGSNLMNRLISSKSDLPSSNIEGMRTQISVRAKDWLATLAVSIPVIFENASHSKNLVDK
jgi:hypothetical protein